MSEQDRVDDPQPKSPSEAEEVREEGNPGKVPGEGAGPQEAQQPEGGPSLGGDPDSEATGDGPSGGAEPSAPAGGDAGDSSAQGDGPSGGAE